MATTKAEGSRPTAGKKRRDTASVPARGEHRDSSADESQRYDILTAALLGVAVGAGAALLLRPSNIGRAAGLSGRAIRKGAIVGGRAAAQGAKWAASSSSKLWDQADGDEMVEHVGEYLASARDRIDGVVEAELSDLRKALRRQRKRVGL